MVDQWVELFAGTAAVGLNLLNGERTNPPFARQGSKYSYAGAVLQVMGLTEGEGVRRVLLNDLDPYIVKLWQTLPHNSEDVARCLASWRKCRIHPSGPAPATCPHCYGTGIMNYYALWQWLRASEPRTDVEACARIIALGAMTVTGLIEAGGFYCRKLNQKKNIAYHTTLPSLIGRALSTNWFRTCELQVSQRSASDIEPIQDSFCYLDPPYKGTAQYRNGCPREEVISIAERWNEAGAVVAISEAVPLAADLRGKWFSVDISDARCKTVGGRAYSKQKREILTLNRLPSLPSTCKVIQ